MPVTSPQAVVFATTMPSSQDTTVLENSLLSSPGVLQFSQDILSREHEAENVRLRNLWVNSMKTRPKATRYLRTAVLMFSWKETDLKTQPEVNDLGRVFEESYNFIVNKVIIGNKLPQIEMSMHLSKFILDYSDKSTLLIVYYAGHGWDKGGPEGEFVLRGQNNVQALKEDFERTCITWTAVEKLLDKAESDVLAIFDCCQAGRLCQFRSPIHFEYLGACAAHELTPPPGPSSFTRALIWALERLSEEEGFPISALLRKIREAPDFPSKEINPAIGHRLFPSPDHIMIMPIKETDLSEQSARQQAHQKREYLDLRFHFPVPLSDSIIKETATALNGLIVDQNIRADCVSLIGRFLPVAEPRLLSVVLEKMASEIVSKNVEKIMEKWGKRWFDVWKQKSELRRLGANRNDADIKEGTSTRASSSPDVEHRNSVSSTRDEAIASTSESIATSSAPRNVDNPTVVEKRRRPSMETQEGSTTKRQDPRSRRAPRADEHKTTPFKKQRALKLTLSSADVGPKGAE